MTSQKQIDANRRNALLSTGPRSKDGKQQSRGNAFRHGLTAQTVIVGAEDAAEYAAFEAEIVADYNPQSVIERELTHRLASLLWRLRRASLIETGLLAAGIAEGKRNKPTDNEAGLKGLISDPVICLLKMPRKQANGDDPNDQGPASGNQRAKQQTLTHAFLQLANLPGAPLERVNRYETTLWRQFVQTLFALDQAKYHRIASSRGRFTPYPPQW